MSKFFGKKRAVENITFNVSEGDFFGLVGSAESGKTTIVRTLLSLIYPTSGSANIFGRDCVKFAHLNAKDIGYLPKEIYYYKNLTVRQMLDYSESLYQKNCIKRSSELCELFSLDKSMRLNDLSVVSIKKLNIISALMHKPKLLVLDEPYFNMDLHTKKIFTDLIIEENLHGMTVLFVTDEFVDAQKLCNKIGFLHDGRLVRILEGEELKDKMLKKICITTNDRIDKDFFYNIEEISQFEQEKDTVKFMFRGNMNQLLKRIMRINTHDIFIEEQSMDEIYKNYFV